jgi:hypothetical protein
MRFFLRIKIYYGIALSKDLTKNSPDTTACTGWNLWRTNVASPNPEAGFTSTHTFLLRVP